MNVKSSVVRLCLGNFIEWRGADVLASELTEGPGTSLRNFFTVWYMITPSFSGACLDNCTVISSNNM